ncbi:MAG TPA: hypothetical protein VJS44_04645 [Pyrinomonadaceae bacterium]|nr:hypothetical protein [Pyrinomonadaceae bacterium]
MPLRFKFEVEGQVQVDRAFLQVEHGADDLDRIGVWEAAAEEFYEIERDEFQTEGQGDWQPWSLAYEKWVLANDPFPMLMRKSQRLYLSLSRKHHEDAVYEAKPKELLIGSRVPYGRYHMTRYKNRPARPPINMTREAYKRRMTKAIQKKLVEFLRGVTGSGRGRGFVQREIIDF